MQRGSVIESARFCREGGRVESVVDTTLLPRFVNEVATQSRLRYSAIGSAEDGKLYLVVEVAGDLTVQCQRCLGEMPFTLRTSTRFLLVEPGQEWPDEALSDDSYEAIPAEPRMDLLKLVEDEALLGLPLVPRHAECQLPANDPDKKPASPFAELAKLKRH